MKLSKGDADIGVWMKGERARPYLDEGEGGAEKGSGKAHTHLWEGDVALCCVLLPTMLVTKIR